MLDTHELAWAAGFFDGEGYCGVQQHQGGRYKTLRLTVSQVTTEPLLRFQAAVGGLGNQMGPYKLNHPTQRPIYTYDVHSFEEVQAVIAMLWKYLCSVKKTQVSEALTVMVPYARAIYEEQLKGLCKRGHPLTGPDADVYIQTRADGSIYPVCRVCKKASRTRRDAASQVLLDQYFQRN